MHVGMDRDKLIANIPNELKQQLDLFLVRPTWELTSIIASKTV